MYLIYCSADNQEHAALTEEADWGIGLRSDKYAYDFPISFVDVKYKRPNFNRHKKIVERLRPRYATVPDLSDKEVSQEDIDRACRQAEELATFCEVVLFVPKLSGQIAMLPPDAAIGYSVPSSYGGAQYPLWELAGRRVHLLGGSPHRQMEIYRYISGIAMVMSADSNMFQLMATRAKIWRRGRWVRHPESRITSGETVEDLRLDCIRQSLNNIASAWQALGA